MLFNSFIFLIFLSVVVPIYYRLNLKNRKYLILFSSYFFYGYWDYRFCFLMLVSTIVDYIAGKYIYETKELKKRKLFLLVSITTNFLILGFFKYYNFFIDSFQTAFSFYGMQLDFLHINLILPVGISFYTFQSLAYTIDIYRKKIKPTNVFIDFIIYVSFFPQLVAGPIERAKNLLPQISKMPIPSKIQFNQGLVLIVSGMFKKVIIGDTTGRIVDQIFAQPSYFSSSEMLMGLILFSIQIYADFSGYSSIARGTAKWFGIELMENFNQPYLSSNITEFWRRWHISLSSWLRDYLYISLGGNKNGNFRTYLNLLITMLLGGLWHGASWTFVVWGALHGFYLSIHKYVLNGKKIKESYSYSSLNSFLIFAIKVILTNILVLFAWLFFRAQSFSDAGYFIKRIINWTAGENDIRVLSIICSFSFLIILFDSIEYYFKDHEFLLRLRAEIRYGIIFSSIMVILIYMFQADPMPFIYFQF